MTCSGAIPPRFNVLIRSVELVGSSCPALEVPRFAFIHSLLYVVNEIIH